MNTARLAKARLYPQKHRSGNVTWCVVVGKKNNGADDIRRFASEEEARNFKTDWNLKLATRDTNGLLDMNEISRTEVMAAMAKLTAFEATITEAVDFFIKHARPTRGRITVEQALDIFLEAKLALKRREAYLRNCKATFYNPFVKAFAGRILSDISPVEAERYINANSKWGNSTRASHVNYLRTFYNFFIKKGYAKLNPFGNIERPQAISTRPKVITPDNADKLLQYALDHSKPACASMALVFFCGVRVEEAGRLEWSDVDLKRAKVKISPEVAKTGHRRVNDIPKNALEWLRLCAGEGAVAPRDYNQHMKRLRAKSGVEYPQNAMRHCFCSYHLTHHKDAAKTAVMLGHPNPALLYRTYYEIVRPEDAEAYWGIVPASVKTARDMERQAEDDAEREAAESQSNCGKAIRKEDGHWAPLQDETI